MATKGSFHSIAILIDLGTKSSNPSVELKKKNLRKSSMTEKDEFLCAASPLAVRFIDLKSPKANYLPEGSETIENVIKSF